jgi:hypothetical protein
MSVQTVADSGKVKPFISRRADYSPYSDIDESLELPRHAEVHADLRAEYT